MSVNATYNAINPGKDQTGMKKSLTDINYIRSLLAKHGFRFSKSLGQNFLCADWVPERIAEEAGLDENTGVLEIGPGIGCLTVQLSERAGRVVSVELDKSLQPILAETLSGCENVTVVFADIMKTDLQKLCEEYFSGCSRICVCANLPYSITTPVLTKLLESGLFTDITVMIQKEVAERIAAMPGTGEYGAFTVLAQWYSRPDICFEVPRNCFIPSPAVTSAVIKLQCRTTPPADITPQRLFSVVRPAFQMRRKTLTNALSQKYDRDAIHAALSKMGLDERTRGETLSLTQFAELANLLEANR